MIFIYYFQFEYDNLVRSFFIGTDVFLRRTDDSLPNRIHEGDIPIYDMAGYSLKHLTKITLSTLRSYMKFTQVEISNYCCDCVLF